jgi:hypothetical protein
MPYLGQSLVFYLVFIVSLMLPTVGPSEKSAASPNKDAGPPYPADTVHPGPAWFIDVAGTAGLRMKNVNGGADTKKYIIETTGSGVAILDYDNDGWPDIFLVNGTMLDSGRENDRPTSHLFRNNHDGTFSDVTRPAGLEFSGWGVWKGTPVMCGPRGLPSSPNLLYHNLGGGKFEDVSRAAGFEKTYGHYCLSVPTLDYDDDSWPDIYVACDSTPSILYHNLGNGTFTDVAAEVGVAFDEDGREQAGMGSTIGDYDNDGHPDIFKTNFSDDASSLYHDNGDGTFSSTISEAGLRFNTRFLGWGTMFMDVDNDGRLDILSVNDHVYPEVDSAHLGSSYKEPRLLYWNAGDGKFKDISQQCGPGCTEPQSSRGLAIADLWNDGRLSAIVNNMNGDPCCW